MTPHLYYSARTGAAPLSFEELKPQVVAVLRHLRREGFFQEWMGVECPSGFTPGRLGPEPRQQLELLAGRAGLFPVEARWRGYGEPELFDVIELLYDHVSRPLSPGRWHDHPECGWHYVAFDRAGGREVMRRYLAPLLARYGGGVQLDEAGLSRREARSDGDEVVVIDVRYQATPIMRVPASRAPAAAASLPAFPARRALPQGT
ncbi:hypothetical protein [Anaeromyxobacter paludicola]|uniref:Uncharacterized protein n=1 Tax=Anaeromyxobacter paludicola TaxID=2918171 RepID=A0ABN6N894_9BACT|nr:hypothetical protein [Anaeromyxobacter paludicola]BDG08167.1 hypothetical protein AMPC_12800 [Anaeromyxobacter paludicola]